MSLFDDDFYSTRVKRSSRRQEQAGLGGSGGNGRSLSTFRVAVVSSLVSALAAVLLFVLITGGKGNEPSARPAMAGGQSFVETSERIISASEKIRPAVVSIINIARQSEDGPFGGGNDEEYGGEFGDELPDNASLGSGVVFEKKGGKAYIITNAHVVADASEVQAVLIDGNKKEAEIVGQDAISDLAVLSVDADGIDTVAEIGDSDQLRVGEMVIAVGNPLGFGDSVTNGIVSFLHRIVPVSLNQDGFYDWEQEVIQTTAAINQGNSGGVLADLNGRVVGINSMKVADTGVEGLGFAIPINTVMPVVEQLMKEGKILRPYMGVFSMDLAVYLDQTEGALTDDSGETEGGGDGGEKGKADKNDEPALIVPDGVKHGALVLEAVGPAKAAGLRLNDIITALDDTPIKGTLDLRKYLYNEKKIGQSLTVTFYRDGRKEEVKLTLTEKDKEQ